MSANVIKRCSETTKMIVLENIDNKDFQIAMGQGMKKATRHFKSLVTPDISGYV